MNFSRYLLCALIAGATTGCAAQDARVAGTVRIAGVPASAGEISFLAPTGATFTARIADDGSFRIDGIPPGEMRVLVFDPPPEPSNVGDRVTRQKAAAGLQQRANATQVVLKPIPRRYAAVATSPLSLDIQAGENHFSVELTP